VANDEKTFAALLSEAPLSQKSDTVTLTGALARSPEEGKFVLMQGDGSSLTLDTDAVKSHTVLGGSFGQQIVQVELDPEKVPKEATEQAFAAPQSRPFSNPYSDPATGSWWDRAPEYAPPMGPQAAPPLMTTRTVESMPLSEQGTYPPYDVPSDVNYLPFALATGHQAPADALAYINAMAYAAPLRRWPTSPNDDGNTVPGFRAHDF